jgi:hypothetical protein
MACIDLPEISVRKLRLVETELVTYRNLEILVRLVGDSRTADEGYGMARALLQADSLKPVVHDFLARRRGDEGIGRRDERMAGEIRRRLGRRPGVRLVHIGGWVHLIDDPLGETLFSRLADLQPDRRLLG